MEEFQRIENTPAGLEEEDEDLATVVKSVPHYVQSILQGALVNNQQWAHNSPFRAKVTYTNTTGNFSPQSKSQSFPQSKCCLIGG